MLFDGILIKELIMVMTNTFIADKTGRHIKIHDVVRSKIQNHPSMEPVYTTNQVMEVDESKGIRFKDNKGFLMFDDKSHPELEIMEDK